MILPDELVPEPLAIAAPDGHVHLRLLDASPPAPLTRMQLRQRRPRLVRARTENMQRMTRRERRDMQAELLAVGQYERPRVRSECEDGERPCPFVGCKYHLYLDVNPKTGSIKLNFPDLDVAQLENSCALDLAGRGPSTLEVTGALVNTTRERVRQIEHMAYNRIRAALGDEPLKELLTDLSEQADAADGTLEHGDPEREVAVLPARDVSDTSGVRRPQGDITTMAHPHLKTVLDVQCNRDECTRMGIKEYGGLCGRHHAGVLNAKRQRGVPKKKRNGKPLRRSIAAAAAAPKPNGKKRRTAKRVDGLGRRLALFDGIERQLQPALDALSLVEKIGWKRAREIAGWFAKN